MMYCEYLKWQALQFKPILLDRVKTWKKSFDIAESFYILNANTRVYCWNYNVHAMRNYPAADKFLRFSTKGAESMLIL
jgi:hypothetical protein